MKLTLSPLAKTWILDLDGSFVVHNGYKLNGEDCWLAGAREFLASIPETDMVIFLTSRKWEYAEETIHFLKRSGVRFNHIIFEAPYGERILVNDKKPSGLQMGYAVNVGRDKPVDLEIETDDAL